MSIILIEIIQAERCSLFLVDKKHNELVAKVFDGNILPDGTTEVFEQFMAILFNNSKISATIRSSTAPKHWNCGACGRHWHVDQHQGRLSSSSLLQGV